MVEMKKVTLIFRSTALIVRIPKSVGVRHSVSCNAVIGRKEVGKSLANAARRPSSVSPITAIPMYATQI